MRPSSRHHVHKGHSASKFKHSVKRTKAPNVIRAPMRGGWRL